MYVPALCFLNLILLVSSTACLYLGSIFINIYLLPYLSLLSSNFATVPYLILSIGALLLLLSICGIVAAASKSRPALITYAIVLGLAFVLQLAAIFTSMELRNEMYYPNFFDRARVETFEEMSLYWVDEDVKFKWDTLQRDFQCCGAYNLHNAYNDWKNAANANNRNQVSNNIRLPDSCCIEEDENCAASFDWSEQFAYRKINMNGCMTIMRKRLHRDIIPVLLHFIICTVVLALISLITLVLSAALVASITRKARQEKDGMGMYQMPGRPHNTGINRYEETSISKPYAETLDSGIVNGSLRSLKSNRSNYSQLHQQETPIIKGDNHRSSLYIEPSNEAGTVI